MSAAPNHFGHREAGGVAVDLFWDRGDLEDVFRVEIEDRRRGTHFVLYPTTGKDAIRAFHRACRPAPRPAADEIGWTTDTDDVHGW